MKFARTIVDREGLRLKGDGNPHGYIADGEVHFIHDIGYIMEFFEKDLTLDEIKTKTEDYLLKCANFNDNEKNIPMMIYRPGWKTEHLDQSSSIGIKFMRRGPR